MGIVQLIRSPVNLDIDIDIEREVSNCLQYINLCVLAPLNSLNSQVPSHVAQRAHARLVVRGVPPPEFRPVFVDHGSNFKPPPNHEENSHPTPTLPSSVSSSPSGNRDPGYCNPRSCIIHGITSALAPSRALITTPSGLKLLQWINSSNRELSDIN